MFPEVETSEQMNSTIPGKNRTQFVTESWPVTIILTHFVSKTSLE